MAAPLYNTLVTLPAVNKATWKPTMLSLIRTREAACPKFRTNNFFFDFTNGSDANEGLSSFTVSAANMAWTVATSTLTQAGVFGSYVFRPYDYIYVKAGTGITPGLYRVVSKVSGNAITISGSISTVDIANGIAVGSGPFKTMTKARTLVAADTAFFLRGGEVWREDQTTVTDLLSINVAGFTIAAYGIGPTKPLLTAFSQQYATGAASWTIDLVNLNTYYRTEASKIARFREAKGYGPLINGTERPYVRASTLADCNNIPYSWFWDSGTSRIYVNYNAADPSLTQAFEAVKSSATTFGIHVQASVANMNTRIEGLVILGWGADADQDADAKYGIQCAQDGGGQCLVLECDSFYNSNHCIGQAGSVGAGAIFTCIRCRAGLCTSDSTFVAHSGTGGAHEGIFYQCTALYGNLFTGTTSWRHVGIPFYAHSTGTITLHVVLDCEVPGGLYCCSTGPQAVNQTVATTLSAVRCFIHGLRQTVGFDSTMTTNAACAVSMCRAYTAIVNCNLKIIPVTTLSNSAVIDGSAQGYCWAFNNLLYVDFMGYAAAAGAFCTFSSAIGDWYEFNNYYYAMLPNKAFQMRGEQTGNVNRQTLRHFGNNIDVYDTSHGTTLTGYAGITYNDNAALLTNNAYHGVPYGGSGGAANDYTVDAGKVILPYPPKMGGTLYADETLFGIGATNLFSLGLNPEYDINMNPTSVVAPSIGPVAPAANSGGSAGSSGSGGQVYHSGSRT